MMDSPAGSLPLEGDALSFGFGFGFDQHHHHPAPVSSVGPSMSATVVEDSEEASALSIENSLEDILIR